MQRIFLSCIGRCKVAEDCLRLIHDAVGDLIAAAGEEVIGKHIPVGNGIHTPCGEGTGVVLQILRLILKCSGTAAHGVASVVRGQRPVGILGCLGGIEGIVAGAGGTQVSKGRIAEAVIIAVLFNLEQQRAVGANRLVAHNRGARRLNGAAVDVGQIALHAGQDALGSKVVNHNLVALRGQIRTDHVVIQLVDGNGLLAGAVAGENPDGVIADNVGLLIRLGDDIRSAVGCNGNGKGSVDILACLRTQQVAAFGRGIEIALILTVDGIQCVGVFLHAGLQRENLRIFVIAQLVIRLDDIRSAAVVGLLAGSQRIVQLAAGNDQNAVAGGERGKVGHKRRLILTQDGRNIDGIGENSLRAVLHALLDSLDGEGSVLGDGNGGGVLNPLPCADLIEDLRTLGSTSEADLRAGIDLTGFRRCLGR